MPAADPTMKGVQFKRGTKSLSVGDFANQVLRNFEKATSGQVEEIQNGDGQTITVVYYDDKIVFTFTVLVKTTGAYTLPDRGGEITLGGLLCHLDDKREIYATAAVNEYSVTATHRPNLGATD